jgi:hypothetical protein
MIDEDGRVLLDRVTDRSWRYKPIVDVVAEPPEYVPAMYGLDHAVCQALAGDWTPAEIRARGHDSSPYASQSGRATPRSRPQVT